jgi:hypothetical protein
MPNSAGQRPEHSPDESPDESSTRPFWPFEAGADPGAGTGGEVGGAGGAELGVQDTDPTALQRPLDATATQRPVGATAVQPPDEAPPRWSARAGVPAPGDPLRRSAPQEWVEEEEDPYHGRSWFTPVIVGTVGLVLVGALSFGLWLIYRATENGQNAPNGAAPPPSASAGSAPPLPSSAAPPSEAPSSAEVTTSAAPTGPAVVVIPPLRGDTLAEATVKLQVLGLNVDVTRTADGSVPPGEVLSSRPGEGETAAPGDTVTLVVATAPSPAPSRSRVSPSASG